MDRLSIAVSFLVAATGSILTYLVNISLTKNNRKYDLKKQIYLEILGNINEMHIFLRQGDEKYNSDNALTISPEEYHKLKEKMGAISVRGLTDKNRLDLAGATGEIISLIEEIYDPGTLRDPAKTKKLVYENLIPKMKSDLNSSEKWLRFLK